MEKAVHFLFQERRAFVRTQTHTVVRDTDPDFDYFRRSQDGIVATLLRIWIKDQDRGGDLPSAYLGSLRFCPSFFPGISELRTVLKRLLDFAAQKRRSPEPLRQELMASLRRYDAKLRLERRRDAESQRHEHDQRSCS